MSRLILLTTICWRVESVRRPRSSGCVYWPTHAGLYDGLKSDVVFVVVFFVFARERLKPPPPQGRFCAMPPVNVVIPFVTPWPAPAPEMTDVDGLVCVCVASVEVSAG